MLQVATLVLSDHRFLIWPVIGIAAGLYGFFRGFRILQRKRLILNTPASKIRSASMGLVEISGIAIGPHVMTSPLKQAECYYYRSVAWEWKRRGKSSEWVKVAEETLYVPFYMDDNTDKLLIDPSGAEMDLHCDFQEEYNRSVLFESTEVPIHVSGFLARHGVNASARIKLEEYCIKPENFLFALGTLSQNPGLDVSVTPRWAMRASEAAASQSAKDDSQSSQEIIRLSAAATPVPITEMTQQQRIAAALAKAGIFATAPWAKPNSSEDVRPAASAQKATAVEERPALFDSTGFDLHPPVVLMKGTNEPTFFISWRSQRDLVNSFNWKSSLLIWGSPLLTLGCVYFLIRHFR
jgi:hypothetical protein